jgi:hypothetical protein
MADEVYSSYVQMPRVDAMEVDSAGELKPHELENEAPAPLRSKKKEPPA